MKKSILPILMMVVVFFLFSCEKKEKPANLWGEQTGSTSSSVVQLEDIISNGELIMVTQYGPETYYDYHGHGMGFQYLLCEKFCETIGVSLRVDVCKDSVEIFQRIKDGEADIAAVPCNGKINGLVKCSNKALKNNCYWLVNDENKSLYDKLSVWLTDSIVSAVGKEESFLLSTNSVKRHVYSPMLNRGKGVISTYDNIFQRYASTIRWDWRLLAAQCYQESTFDPHARSWVGACGLMQIMPYTADEVGLPRAEIYNPEKNVAAAVRYINKLNNSFSDIPNSTERMKFVLASYNGGTHHVRDAMALTRKHGRSPYRWEHVREYVLALQRPEYYRDPVVKNGYMRGSETVGYVDNIWRRWLDYRGVKTTSDTSSESTFSPVTAQPHPSAGRKAKYNL